MIAVRVGPEVRGLFKSRRLNASLLAGVAFLSFVLLFGLIGGLLVDHRNAEVGAVLPNLSPSGTNFLGTDAQGRDMWTIMVVGTPETVKIGLIAGGVGLIVGLVLGLVSGFFGGAIDMVIRMLSDSFMTIPALAILVVIATHVTQMTVELMGLTVASLAWMYPARTIRAQVLSIRERAYVEVARASGGSGLVVLFTEVMPNLLPFIAASFVASMSGAILAAVGLEALGLGANQVHTLGTTIYWSEKFSAVLRGEWWWWGPPIVMIAIIFVGLYLLSSGLDRLANPRLQEAS